MHDPAAKQEIAPTSGTCPDAILATNRGTDHPELVKFSENGPCELPPAV
jgi:hypothetical protein